MDSSLTDNPERRHQGHYTKCLDVVASEDERDPELSTTYIAYTCGACGSLVRDRGFHDEFWRALERRLGLIEEQLTIRECDGSPFGGLEVRVEDDGRVWVTPGGIAGAERPVPSAKRPNVESDAPRSALCAVCGALVPLEWPGTDAVELHAHYHRRELDRWRQSG